MDEFSFIDIAGITGVERQNLVQILNNVQLGYFDSDFPNGVPIDQQPDAQVEENPPQAGLNHGQNGHQPQMEENLAQGGPTAKQNGAMNGPQEALLNCERGPSENPLLSGREPQPNQVTLDPCASVFEPQGIKQCQNMAQMPQAANPWTSAPNGSSVSYADRLKGMNRNGPRPSGTSQTRFSHQGRQQRMKRANGRYDHSNHNGYNGHNGQNDSAVTQPSLSQFSKREEEHIVTAVYHILSKQQVDSVATYEVPEAHGIRNSYHQCFMISALQTLFAVNGFAALLSDLTEATKSHDIGVVEYKAPFFVALLRTWRDYKNKTDGLSLDKYIMKHLHLLRNSAINTVQQGDASEFLLYLLIKLQEELRLLKYGEEAAQCMNGAENGQGEAEGWQQVKVGRRSGRRQVFSDSNCPLTRLFGGTVFSMPVRRKEPFITLDISTFGDDINSVTDAIREHFAEQMTDSNRRTKITLCQLPETLISVMKCSLRKEDGTKKQLDIAEWLRFEPEWVTDEIYQKVKKEKLSYRLCSAIIHSGLDTYSGHYWCFTRRKNGQWYYMDDEKAFCVGFEAVLNYHNNEKNVVPHCLVFQLHKG